MKSSAITVLLFAVIWLLYHLSHRSARRRITLRYEENVRRYVEEFGETESGAKFIADANLVVVQDNSWALNPIHRASVHYLVSGSTVGQAIAVGVIASAMGSVVDLFSGFGKHKGKTPDQIRLEEEICGIAAEFSGHEKQYDWIVVLLLFLCCVAAIAVYFA